MEDFLLDSVSLFGRLSDFSFSIWKLVLLFNLMMDFSIDHFLVLLDYLSAFNTILVRINFMNSSSMWTFMRGLMTFVIHQLVQLIHPTGLNQWPEEIFLLWCSERLFREKFFENVMSASRMKSFESKIIVSGSFFIFTESIVGLIDFDKLFESLLIIRILLWMIF